MKGEHRRGRHEQRARGGGDRLRVPELHLREDDRVAVERGGGHGERRGEELARASSAPAPNPRAPPCPRGRARCRGLRCRDRVADPERGEDRGEERRERVEDRRGGGVDHRHGLGDERERQRKADGAHEEVLRARSSLHPTAPPLASTNAQSAAPASTTRTSISTTGPMLGTA